MRCLAPSSDPRDEWFVHFFTVVYADRADALSVYWYKGRAVNRELFEDVRLILERMKEYRLCASYTGDVLCVSEERVFLEKLVLLGLQGCVTATYDWPLQSGGSLEIEGGVCLYPAYFQQMSGVCFQDYDVWHSFSSTDPSDPVTVIAKQQSVASVAAVTAMVPREEEARLIFVSVFGHSVLMAWCPLAITGYSVFHCAIEERQLYTWFVSMVQQRQYALAKQQIAALDDYHTLHPVLTSPLAVSDDSVVVDAVDAVDAVAEEMEKEEEAKRVFVLRSLQEVDSPMFWVHTFCDLYLEESAEYDTLLSEIYQDYLTFSEWGEREKLVSMTAFVKTLRATGRYTIKRRSKGMTLVGHCSLVSRQEALYEAVKHGQGYERNLLQYRSAQDIQTILGLYTELVEHCHPIYSREACVALHDRGLVLDDAILYSFCRIPGMTEQLKQYHDYLEALLARPLAMDHQTDCEDFRELAERCVLYYPFRLGANGFARPVTALEEVPDVTLDEQFHGLRLSVSTGGEEVRSEGSL